MQYTAWSSYYQLNIILRFFASTALENVDTHVVPFINSTNFAAFAEQGGDSRCYA
jgi:hypothetical protein